MIEIGLTPDWIVDKNPELQNNSYLGVPIRPTVTLSEANSRYVVLASSHIREMSVECTAHNAANWVLPAAIHDFCPMVGEIGLLHHTDLPYEDMAYGYSLLADDKSREIFLAFLKYHYTFDNDFTGYCDPTLYFPDDLSSLIDYSNFVDVGAFTGDTCMDWVNKFTPLDEEYHYYAFEPDKESYLLLSEYIDSLPECVHAHITSHRMAIGSVDGFIELSGSDGSSFIGSRTNTSNQIPIGKIDSLFADKKKVTIIKADIEGAEIQLLEGAVETIRRCRSVLALSVYHRVSDLWQIPTRIHDLKLNYSIYLRHHQNVFSDTVCYAIPRGKGD
ncbi:hypothetical protein AGMMS50276_32930 [Synergistales bacterium]|nr:hypothetical protein AGMMS50276_32930 [Synergistales bacterium]